MADARHSSHYPAVQNHIINDPTPKDQAIYVPSVTPGFAMDVFAKKWARALPNSINASDLNFLDPNNRLFRISHVMTSAGQALSQPRPCIITQRNRASTIVIGDSGGYQIATNQLRISGNSDRLRILRWLEKHTDVSMTLDVPTGPVRKPGYAFKATKDCLNATLEHLDFFQKHRVPGKIRLLNVLQGNTTAESDAWYNAVKKYDFEGWAFAGLLRHNAFNFCRRIIQMAGENQIQNKSWIHVLGTCELDTAVLLTAFQRAINKYLNPDLRISFDTSSPFRNLRWGNVYTIPQFDKKRMTMPTRSVPDAHGLVGSDIRWPWPSPLGDRMTLEDFCVQKSPTATSYRDTQSNHYLAHHNLAALCWGVALANRVFDSEIIDHKHTIAYPVGAAVEAIDTVFALGGSMTALRKFKFTFDQLRHGAQPDTGDEERDF
jgi:hypothetical protein